MPRPFADLPTLPPTYVPDTDTFSPVDRAAQRAAASPDLVFVVSPFSGNVKENVIYARMACADCLERGEIPVAGHLLFPQFMDDSDPVWRRRGIECGHTLMEQCGAVVVYTDLGISEGMKADISTAARDGVLLEWRSLGRTAPDVQDLMEQPFPPFPHLSKSPAGAHLTALLEGLDGEAAQRAWESAESAQDFLAWLQVSLRNAQPLRVQAKGTEFVTWSDEPQDQPRIERG